MTSLLSTESNERGDNQVAHYCGCACIRCLDHGSMAVLYGKKPFPVAWKPGNTVTDLDEAFLMWIPWRHHRSDSDPNSGRIMSEYSREQVGGQSLDV